MPAPVPYQLYICFVAWIELYRTFKTCNMSVNKLKCNKKLFVSCQRLLIWETLTCSWRNVITADVLPRFSRQPMDRRRRNFSFHPSFVPQLKQSSWEAVHLKVFFPLGPCVHHIFSLRTKLLFVSSFSAVFWFSFIAFYSKTRLEELQGCYKPKLCDPVMSLLRSWTAIGWLWGSCRLWLARLAVRLV